MATIGVKPDCVEPQVDAEADGRQVVRPVRVLIVFNTVFLYGMERQVIESFDLLRPEVEPHFLLSYTTYRKQLPLLTEIERRGLEHSFFSDRTDWPKIGRPRSLRQTWQMAMAMIKGNRDVLRRSLDCDAIYLPATGYGYFALLGALYCRLRRKRVVFEFHDLPRTWQLRLRLVSMLATDCVHQTRFGYDFSARTNPYLARKKTFICPTRTQAWRLCDSDPQVRRALAGKRNLLFVGQVSHHKGIDLLLEAFGSLASHYSDIHLHVLGGGPEEQEMRSRIESARLDSRVHLWGYRHDVDDFLRMTYLYIHPSPPSRFHECFPRGALEAMSQEVPTVCFRSGGLQEMVVHEKTGLVCEEETPECLAANIRRFLDDPRFRSSCAHGALSRFQELYSDDRVRARWIEFAGQKS
ncbi:MAG: glycosyltransferase family 4 protein [Terriglobales bacterium]